jgi:hypothetical protein
VAALPIVALNNLGQILLKLRHRLRMVMVVNIASFVVILVLAELWLARGLFWVALAWLFGNLIAAVLAWADWFITAMYAPKHAMAGSTRDPLGARVQRSGGSPRRGQSFEPRVSSMSVPTGLRNGGPDSRS